MRLVIPCAFVITLNSIKYTSYIEQIKSTEYFHVIQFLVYNTIGFFTNLHDALTHSHLCILEKIVNICANNSV